MKDTLAVTLGNCVSFCGFAFGVLVIGPLYGLAWALLKLTRVALFHAIALALWPVMAKRVKALSLLVNTEELQ